VIAGDIFHKWNSSASLINFAIEQFARFRKIDIDVYAVPGQHDLPYHNYEDISRSAYWTLIQAGVVKHLDKVTHLKDVTLHPFAWGKDVTPLDEKVWGKPVAGHPHLAVVHKYVWASGSTSYPGAKEDERVNAYTKKLDGYDAALFGDNHKGFKAGKINNNGTFMRRNKDERLYHPTYGLLYRDGTQERVCFETQDSWISDHFDLLDKKMSVEGFLEVLNNHGETFLDFHDSMNQYLDVNKIPKEVREMILKSMEQ